MGSERWWTRVCAKDDVPFLEGRRVEVDGFYVGMFNTEEGFCAVHNVCPYRGGPLCDWDVAAATITCPLHARKINPKTGEVLNDDGFTCTPTCPPKVEDGSVYLDVRALSPLAAPSTA